MGSLLLSPPGLLFLRLGESKLLLGRAPANPTTQIPCDTSGSWSNATRELLTAWQTRVATAPALQLSCCPAVLEYVSTAALISGSNMCGWGSASGSKLMELFWRNAASKKKTVSVLERRKLCTWSNIPATSVHASNRRLALLLAALL